MKYKQVIFSHLPKSGGTYIAFVLSSIWSENQLDPDTLRFVTHVKLNIGDNFDIKYNDHRMLYDLCVGNPPNTSYKIQTKQIKRSESYIFGCIRNPFDYYISIWGFGCANTRNTGGILQRVHRYKPSLLKYYKDSYNIDNFRSWLHEILKPSSSMLWCIDNARWIEPNITDIQLYDIGLLSYRINELYFQSYLNLINPNNYYGILNTIIINNGKDTNTLNTALMHLCHTLNLKCDIQDTQLRQKYNLSNTVCNNQVYNTTDRLPYQEYYDDETRQLVEHKDRYIFQKYCFTY